jgi:hypothetical protein
MITAAYKTSHDFSGGKFCWPQGKRYFTGELETHRMGQENANRMVTERFREHLKTIREEVRKGMPIHDLNVRGEIGTEGIIITSDPYRPHGHGDRLIVTTLAPAIEWSWQRTFRGDHGVHPRMGNFIDIFADITEAHTKDDDPAHLLQGIIDAILSKISGEFGA